MVSKQAEVGLGFVLGKTDLPELLDAVFHAASNNFLRLKE